MEIVRSVLDSLGFDPVIFASQIVLFYAMHLVLTPVLYRPMEKARNDRDALTLGRVHDADRINREALALKARYEAEIRQARQAAQAGVDRARAEAEAARVTRLEAARAEADAVIRAAHEEIAGERSRAEGELQARVPDLSLAVASRLVETLATDAQRERVVARLREAS